MEGVMPTLESMRGDLAFSSRIAAAVLDALAESGDYAARTRALRALGHEDAAIYRRGHWLGAGRLAAMLRAAAIDRRIARRLGQSLVRPDGVGLALCYSGLATTEKAYRRTHSLLARESEAAEYEPRELAGQRARIRFHPPSRGHSDRLPDDAGALLCAVRGGMLEAVPLLFGLVPARVRETRCGYAGAEHCEFEVTWSRDPRIGLFSGAAAGFAIMIGLLFAASTLGWSLWAVALGASALCLLTAAAGRSFDLARQLEAVAGARRGHLALLDQIDSSLAERMDDLAKLGSLTQSSVSTRGRSDDEPTGLVPVDRHGPLRSRDGEVAAPERSDIAEASRAVRDAVAGLRDAFSERRQRAGSATRSEQGQDGAGEHSGRDDFAELTRRMRAIEQATAALDRLVGRPESGRRDTDLRALIGRAVADLRAERARGHGSIQFELVDETADQRPVVQCDPHQIEFVIEQLLRNAITASEQNRLVDADDAPEPARVRVAMRTAAGGIEVAVEDDGPGIDPDVVERVFDPFDDGGPAGRNGGLGLPVCLRIIQEHGGELQIRGGEGQGTCVSFVLPRAASGDGTTR